MFGYVTIYRKGLANAEMERYQGYYCGLCQALGRRYGDAPAGGQSLGQKNTVLAVWMAQSFLDPISSIAPTAYIVWQNFVNSYQIYKKDRETTKNQI
jgi:hypothetical protein